MSKVDRNSLAFCAAYDAYNEWCDEHDEGEERHVLAAPLYVALNVYADTYQRSMASMFDEKDFHHIEVDPRHGWTVVTSRDGRWHTKHSVLSEGAAWRLLGELLAIGGRVNLTALPETKELR